MLDVGCTFGLDSSSLTTVVSRVYILLRKKGLQKTPLFRRNTQEYS